MVAGRHVRWVSPRRSRRLLARTGRGVAVVAAVVAVVALVLTPGEFALQGTARELRERGAATTADEVDVVTVGGGRFSRTRADVVFRTAEGRRVATRLETSGDGVDLDSTRPGMAVVYDPWEPDRAMSAPDVDYYADDAVEGALGLGALAAVVAVAGAGTSWVASRPRRRRWWSW